MEVKNTNLYWIVLIHIFIESVAPRLAKCGICKERYVDTLVGMCGHVFCESCAYSLDCDEEDGTTCPYCNEDGFIQNLYGLTDD